MNQELIDRALHAANRTAADRGIELDQDALMGALVAVTGDSNGQDDPEEIAEGALELLGKAAETTSSKRGPALLILEQGGSSGVRLRETKVSQAAIIPVED